MLAYFKEAVDQLIINGETYSILLYGKSHNFPIPFPIGNNISIDQTILDEYHYITRKAQTKFEFANIYEHRKTQKILIAGFQTLAQAINNMGQQISTSIVELKYSIKSEFKELKTIQIEQVKTFETGIGTINKTLNSIDKKLYYLQYNERPNLTFVRPLSDF